VTAADVVADGLRRAGIARAFVAAGADATLSEALRDAGLPIVDVPEAAAACVMAAVTGRLSETPGLAVVASDDGGVTTALARAARERAPVVVLASVAPTSALVKTIAVAGTDSAAHWAAHAAQAAMAEPEGCVWLVLAREIAPRAALPVATVARAAAAPGAADVEAVERALAAATRPLVVAGRGCRARGTAAWLRAFAEALPAPVLVTPAARGAMPDPHPLCHGLLRPDARVVTRADVVLALGVDDDELAERGVTFAAPLVRVGRVATLLEELAPRLAHHARADWDVAELDRLRRASAPTPVPAALAALVSRLREATPAGTAAVFAPSLDAAGALWQAVQPGDVLVHDDVAAASVAVALERPEAVVLAFGAWRGVGPAALSRAGVRVFEPIRATLEAAAEDALASSGPRVLLVPMPG
jgi:thiamine pyrophosphate-dependent acetolactate synthase large subunit-like protein